ncbi:di-heme oxidoredictase family protein [Leptospira santarosai]|uniref:di-heme oxidoreductase family protein n=1 Tax=Leptospira santarosai TaxID=28183 RepID=UPI000773F409|nr:di-heme oxidoredictase family protein [Leptospira santarosai]MDI7203192.1 di-heme oxidoredictase family protein [Leptospira santarosai]
MSLNSSFFLFTSIFFGSLSGKFFRVVLLFVFLSTQACSPKKKFCSSKECQIGAVLIAILSESASAEWEYENGEEYQGGREMTSFEFGSMAFRQFARNAPLSSISQYTVGQTVFEVPWIPGFSAAIPDRDGLGPLFHTNACSACHAANGRTLEEDGENLTSSLVRLSVGNDSSREEPNYGGQFQPNSVQGVAKEGDVSLAYREIVGEFEDGTKYTLRSPLLVFSNLGYGPFSNDTRTSVRVPPQVIGLGLLETIPEDTILALADPDDRDGNGISGRPNYVRNLNGIGATLGRFGWKANNTDLTRQSSAAFLGDLGITSPMFQNENCTDAQVQCRASRNGGSPEIAHNRIAAISNYLKLIAVPARRKADNESVLLGKKIFFQAGCKNCHLPKIQTGLNESFPELSNQTIRPYTDLLLHDMGEGLADNRPDEEANGREWRTPPLWGIGLFEEVNGHTRYLHDGRARNLMEAILWHGGESESSKNYILKLDVRDRAHLVNFLKSL